MPEAHVEAPTPGSIILASILLKLGSYAILRIMLVLFFNVSLDLIFFILVLSLFSFTYASMVALSQIDIKKIKDVLKKVELYDIFKDNLFNSLGENGIKISGGQKQRVAIARALYQNTEILVLDEATSSLDNKTERIIQNIIKNLKTKMTVISIAHRFSTIKNCDWIFLLENGTLKEEGTYEELKKNSALFRELAKSQINDIN